MSVFGKYNKKPVQACLDAREYILGYLKGLIGKCLSPTNQNGIEYTTDSDWAGLFNVDGDCRSRYGVLITIGDMSVAWRSGRMKPGTCDDSEVKMSSGEAEVCAASEGLKLAKHIKYICDELGVDVPDRIYIGVDASVVVAFANNTQVRSKMKHVNLSWAWVQDLKDKYVVNLYKIDSATNPSDFSTKILTGPGFVKAQKVLIAVRT